MSTVKLAVVGLGTIAHGVHFENIEKNERVQLAAVCDIVEERAKESGEKYDVPWYAGHSELLEKADIDAVLICTPHYSHTTIGIDTLNSGRHLLVEKPISVHKADCEKLIAAHGDKSLVFGAMFMKRTIPVFCKAREIIASGQLGEIHRAQWTVSNWYRTQTYYDSGSWRATWEGEGGGVLLNQCPHELDLWQWLLGMPSRIRAFCSIGKRHSIEVEDEVTAFMEYDNGSTAVFITSTCESPGTNCLEIAGDLGLLRIEGGSELTFKRNIQSVTQHITTSPEMWGSPECEDVVVEIESGPGMNGHGIILDNFVDAICNGTELIAPAADGINSVELANTMLYSSLMNKTIDLPLDSKVFEQKLYELIAHAGRVPVNK